MVAPGIPLRIPVVGQMYWLPREAYNRQDQKPGRPCVVVAVYPAGRYAVVVTRTTSAQENGDIPHPAQPSEPSLDKPGWFQPARRAHDVAFGVFDDPDSQYLGELDVTTLGAVVSAWRATR